MTFGSSLLKLLEQKGKTQKELADMIEVDYGYLSRIVRNKATFTPSRAFVLKVAEKLECDDSEKSELLKEAGHLDEELEQIAKEATDRPKLKTLFKSAPNLNEKQLDLINRKIQDILKSKKDK